MIIEFFKKLFGVKETKKEYPVIIPDHRKDIIKKEVKEKEISDLRKTYLKEKTKKITSAKIDKKLLDKKIKDIDLDKEVSVFEVEGVYSLAGMALINGFVEIGRLKSGMKSRSYVFPLKIIEVRKNNEKVPAILAGENGTILIDSKKNPILRKGDYLEFE